MGSEGINVRSYFCEALVLLIVRLSVGKVFETAGTWTMAGQT